MSFLGHSSRRWRNSKFSESAPVTSLLFAISWEALSYCPLLLLCQSVCSAPPHHFLLLATPVRDAFLIERQKSPKLESIPNDTATRFVALSNLSSVLEQNYLP